MRWMFLPFYRYAEFSGRSRRREYWLFQLLNIVVLILCCVPVMSALMASDEFAVNDADKAQLAFLEQPQSIQSAYGDASFGKVNFAQVQQKRSCEPFCSSNTPSNENAPDSFVFDDLDGAEDSFVGDSLTGILMASSGFIALIIWWLGSFIPQLAVTVRRLHDVNMSGWLLIPFYIGMAIPFLGFLVSLVFVGILWVPGTKGRNQYGDDPKSEQGYDMVFA